MASKVFRGLSIQKDIKTTDLLGCALSVVIILFATSLIPVFGPLLRILTPLPFLFYSCKLGLIQGIKISLITLFILGLLAKLTGYLHLLLLGIQFGLLGLIISELFRRELSFGLTIFWGTTLMLIIGIAAMFIIGAPKGIGPIELVKSYFLENLKQTAVLYENTDLDQEKLLQIKQFIELLTKIVARIFPSLVIIWTGLIVWVNTLAGKALFKLKGITYPDFEPLDRWQAPELMVWALIVAGFSLFLKIESIKLLALNALIIMSVIYIFNGLSIMLFFLKKYNVPRWVRFGIYALIIIQQMSMFILALMGLFDQWIDFRKINKKAV